MGVNKLYNIYQAGKQFLKNRKIAKDITEPKQLKKTLENIGKDYKYSSARERESFRRLNKKLDLEKKRTEGIQASKELKKMVDTGQAEKIGSRNKIFSKEVPPKRTRGEGKKDEFVVDKIEKKAKGGRIGFKGGKLVGGQKKIDVAAPFGKITGQDFKKLRNKKKVI